MEKLEDFLIKAHREMLDAQALYEELSDENELKTDEEINELFEYHRIRHTREGEREGSSTDQLHEPPYHRSNRLDAEA